jgi:NAD kinase
MSTLAPRVVLVTRETEFELLVARHATREQARFFLQSRGQDLLELQNAHQIQADTLKQAYQAIPANWRHAQVMRSEFDRFLFGAEDIVVAIGQDGLVANIAKYLNGQHVIGINPDPARFDGVLVRNRIEELPSLLQRTQTGNVPVDPLTMVEAMLDDGSRLLALNEIFVGHNSHQSARYEIICAGQSEFHSSSGVIISSGTGSTGWSRSIMEAAAIELPLTPKERAVNFFVREPFASVSTQTQLRCGRIPEPDNLVITSRLNSGGTVFADGIEQDFLNFDWGRRLQVKVAKETLQLV